MAKKRIDWIAVKVYYFRSLTTTFKDVAKEFGVSWYTIKNRAYKEGWNKEREEKLGEVEEKALEKQGEDIVAIRVRQSRILKAILSKALARLEKMDLSSLEEKEVVKTALDILKSERELYPKQLEVGGKISAALSLEDIPQEIIDAFIEVFKRKIRGESTPRVTSSPETESSAMGG